MFLLMPTICRASKTYCPNLDRVSLKSQTTFITITIIITTIITITTFTTDFVISVTIIIIHPRHTFTIIWFEWICILWLASSCWLSIFSLWQLIPYSAHLNSWKSRKHDIHTSKCVWLLSQTDQEDLHFILPSFWGLGQILIWSNHIIFVKNFWSKKTHKILDCTDKCFWWWNGSQPRVTSAVGVTTVCCK